MVAPLSMARQCLMDCDCWQVWPYDHVLWSFSTGKFDPPKHCTAKFYGDVAYDITIFYDCSIQILMPIYLLVHTLVNEFVFEHV